MKMTFESFIALALFSSSALATGGISSGTPPLRIEASCATEDGLVQVNVEDQIGGSTYAIVRSPEGEAKFDPVEKVPETYPGTPSETPRKFESRDFELKIWITGMPVGPNPNLRKGEVMALVNGHAIRSGVDCEMYL